MTQPQRNEILAVLSILLAGFLIVPQVIDAFEPEEVPAMAAQVHSDLRTLCAALEAYRLDNGAYPLSVFPGGIWDRPRSWAYLTTPVAYLETIPLDPFSTDTVESGFWFAHYIYIDRVSSVNNLGWPYDSLSDDGSGTTQWRVAGIGPDEWWNESLPEYGQNLPYDPTNGIVSPGDIIIWGPGDCSVSPLAFPPKAWMLH